MYINSISSSCNNLPVSNTQFKSKGSLFKALTLCGVLMTGTTSCLNNSIPNTRQTEYSIPQKVEYKCFPDTGSQIINIPKTNSRIVRMTEGLVKDRNEDEIKMQTGLTKIQVNTVINILTNLFNTKYWKYDKCEYVGSVYKKGLLSDSFHFRFKSGNHYFDYQYNKKTKLFTPTNLLDKLGDPYLEFIPVDDESFAVKGDGIGYSEYSNNGISLK